MKTRFGHYGTTAAVLAGAGVLALILHLAVPYAHVNPSQEGAESEVLTRGEAADYHDDSQLIGASSPAVTLAGTIVLLVAGLGLLVAGFFPMPVAAARLVGWGGGLVASIGALMAFTSSMYWVGAGLGQYPFGFFDFGSFDFGVFGAGGIDLGAFALGGLTGGLSGLLELMFGTDNAGTVWIIGPVFTATLGAVALVAALRLCGNVVSLENGYRERARRHLKAGLWAALFLGLVLLLPWSIGEVGDYSGEEDTDYFVFGAHTILNAAEATDGELFDGMAYALTVMTAAGWIGVLVAILGSLGGVLASTGAPAPLARALHYGVFLTAFMTLYAFVMFVLAVSYMWKPSDGADGFQPGWFSLLALPALALWGWTQWRVLRTALQRTAAGRAASPAASPVSFE